MQVIWKLTEMWSDSVAATLSEATFKTTLVTLGALAVLLLMRRCSAAWRHGACLAALSVCVLAPLIGGVPSLPTFRVLPGWASWSTGAAATVDAESFRETSVVLPPASGMAHPIAYPIQPMTSASLDMAPSPTSDSIVASPSTTSVTTATVITMVWLSGATAFAVMWGAGIVRLRRLVGRAATLADIKDPQASALLKKHVRRCSDALQVPVPIVHLGDPHRMPMAWGLLHGHIMIPQDATDWSEDRLNAVLLHEMAHLRRRDPMTLLVVYGIRSLYWFQPLVWALVWRLRVERERACDDLVLGAGVRASSYAEQLLHLASALKPSRVPSPVALAMARSSQLEGRLRSILDPHRARARATRGATTAIALFTVAFSVGVAGLQAAAPTATTAAPRPVEVSPQTRPTDPPEKQGEPPAKDSKDATKSAPEDAAKSLADAIAEFNRAAAQHFIGRKQPKLAEAEVVKAAKRQLQQDETPDDVRQALHAVVERKQFPKSLSLRWVTRVLDGSTLHGVWWVRLVGQSAQSTVVMSIRSEPIFQRPLSQLERQHWHEGTTRGITSINRLAGYFEDDPQFGVATTVNPTAADALVKKTIAAAANVEELSQLYHWPDAKDPERNQLKQELQRLIDRKIIGASVEPRKHKRELVHWQAFRTFRPCLPVIGYLKLDFQTGDPLKLEIGDVDGSLKLVHYVLDKKLTIPKQIGSIANSGFMQRLPDGRHALWFTITPQEILIPLKLANHEVWLTGAKNNPKVAGVVTSVKDKLMEISFGSDDGIGEGQEIYVFRDQLLLGRAKVRRVEPDRAVAEIFEFAKGNEAQKIQKGDRVATDKSLMTTKDPKPADKPVGPVVMGLDLGAAPIVSKPPANQPDLYEPSPDDASKIRQRKDVFSMPLPTVDGKASSWLRYAPRVKRFYISYRASETELPQVERLYGPFAGDPFEKLGLQAMMKKSLEEEYNPDYLYRIRLMLRTRDPKLAERSAELLAAVLKRPGDASELSTYLGSIEQIVNEHTATWKDLKLPEKAEELATLLKAANDLIASRVAEIPDKQYTSAADAMPKPPAKVNPNAWGQPVNGLRMAIAIDPDSAPVGTEMHVKLIVQNVSGKEIRLGEYDLRQDAEADIRTTAQDQVKSQRSFFTGISEIHRFRLKPQEMVVLAQVSVRVVADRKDAPNTFGCTLIVSPNEKQLRNQVFLVRYRIHLGRVISWGRNEQGVMVRMLPAKGEWTGEVSSGQVAIAAHLKK